MKILLVGEPFRSGGQGTRVRDLPESHDRQRLACMSHVALAESLESKGIKTSFFIESYATRFKGDLESWYGARLSRINLRDNLVGLQKLVRDGMSGMSDDEPILVCRIDLMLKEFFKEVFDPNWKELRFPFSCWIIWCMVGSHPRVSDMMMFVPSEIIPKISAKPFLSHEAWAHYEDRGILRREEMGLMLDTYHDSDSAKDYNPLYRIANRHQSEVWHSVGYVVGEDFEPKPTEDRRVFPDWPPNWLASGVGDIWEWWHQDADGHPRFINFIRFSNNEVLGQRVEIYKHPDQTYWRMEGDSMVIMHEDGRVTSRLTRVSEESYSGPYEFNKSVTFTIRKVKPEKWLGIRR